MWIRKPEEEIQEYLNRLEAKRRSLLRPFWFALALTASTLILYQWGCRGGSMRSGVVIVSTLGVFTFGAFIAGAFLFAIFFVFFVYLQRHRGLYSPFDSVLCRECKQPSHANPEACASVEGNWNRLSYWWMLRRAKEAAAAK
jgi:hypothetical protein